MDKFRLVVIALGTLIIVTFSLYNFGYYISPSIPQSGAEISPVSSFDSVTNSRTAEQTSNSAQVQKTGSGTRDIISNLPSSSKYKNWPLMKIVKNLRTFYSIQFPTDMIVTHGNRPGSVVAESPQGVFSVDLVDIPDDSNVELYLLTNIKPSLESALQNFSQIKFSSTSVGDNRAWELAYTWKNATPYDGIRQDVC